MASATNAAAPTNALTKYFVAASRPRIILFGDSLTERSFEVPGGWGNSLAATYTRRADVVNRGLSGYNSRWARHAAPQVFGPPLVPGSNAPAAWDRILFSTILLGANDAARLKGPSHSARQHVPVDEYASNLKEIVAYMRAAGVERIVLMTPPPVWDAGRKAHQLVRMGEEARDWPLDRTLEDTEPYAKAAAAVAAEAGVPCIDLFNLMQQEEKWGERLLCDGLHFTALGQAKLFALLEERLAQDWPEIRPQELPAHLPPWEAIDFGDLKGSFSTRKD